MTNTKLFLLLGTSLSFIPQTVNAQCVATQDCATLGYTQSSCNGGKGVKCPFGNVWACFPSEEDICKDNGFIEACSGEGQIGVGHPCGKLYSSCSCSENYQYACSGNGYKSGSGQACNGKYASCSCADGYDWRDGACKQKDPDYSACKIGTLFYSDNTCSDKMKTNKKLLGVVVYEKTAGESGWVMTVKHINQNTAWSTESVKTGVEDKAASASCSNTKKLVALGADKYPAAQLADKYVSGGKKWCLPAYDILNNIANRTNFTKVNNAIQTAGGTVLGNVYNSYEMTWSSSEHDKDNAGGLRADVHGNLEMRTNGKNDRGVGGNSVRPVFAF